MEHPDGGIEKLNMSMGELNSDSPQQCEQDQYQSIHEDGARPTLSRTQQWKLGLKAIAENRLGMLVILLGLGMSVDMSVDISGPTELGSFQTLLQSCIYSKCYDMVSLLVRHNVNVNSVLEHCSPLGLCQCDCKSIMCCVFFIDDPVMMKLLLPKYDIKCNWDERSLIHMACKAGAFKCVDVLLKSKRSDDNLPSIYLCDELMVDVLCKLEHVIYNPEYHQYCVHEAVERDNSCYKDSKPTADSSNVLHSLRNLFWGSQFLNPLKSAIEENECLNVIPRWQSIEMAILFVLHKECGVKMEIMNDFLIAIFNAVIQTHSEDVTFLLLSCMSKIYAREHFRQISRIDKSEKLTSYRCGQRERLHGILLAEKMASSHCIKNQNTIRLAILNIDLLFGDIDCFYSVCSCTCPTYMLHLWVQIWKHSSYLVFLGLVHDRKIYPNNQFPCLRSLKALSRVSIMHSLHFPRTLTAEALPLPRYLKVYLCLKY